MLRRIRWFLKLSLLVQGIALLIVLLWRWLSGFGSRKKQYVTAGEGLVEPAAHEPTAPAVAVAPPEPAADDLRRIEGIGPKTAAVLVAAGVRTFAGLAAADVEWLRGVLRQSGLRLGDPRTWPEQAALAAAGDWEGLAALQGQLKGGRRVA